MTRQQVLLIVGGLIAVVLIYQLPRVVVENETAEEVDTHDFSISDEDTKVFASLRQVLKESDDIKKSINFADSLASLALKYQMVDTAAYYAEKILQMDSSFESKQKSAMLYYRAYQMTNQQTSMVELAARAKELFEDLLQEDPKNSSLKNKLAMTMMVSDAPMAGVQILREVLAEDPNNREAILNLGLLAIQSGQYDRAIERFERLVELDSTDSESLFYLGVSYAESEMPEDAKEIFEHLSKREDVDPALKATASNYLKDL